MSEVSKNEALAAAVATRIDGSPSVLRCERMTSGFANANYRLETSAGTVLMRECTGRDLAAVEYELNVLDWLRHHQFPCAAVIPFAGGERWIGSPGGGTVVLLEWLTGVEPVPNETNVGAIAGALAEMHRLPPPEGDWWHRENPIGAGPVSQLAGSITGEDPDLFQFFAREFASLEDRLDDPLPTGLVHGDLFTDNTLFLDDQLVAVLDFEDACESPLLFDVAMTIHGFCFPDEQWRPDLAEVFLKTYSQGRPLEKEERELLPVYLRWCPLVMMGWHLRKLREGLGDEANVQRAQEHGRRVATMAEANWP